MVDKTQIENDLTSEIATILAKDEDEVTPNTPLESLGIDSIRLIEVLIFIEKKYGLRMMDSGLKADSLRDAASLADAVSKALEGRNV